MSGRRDPQQQGHGYAPIKVGDVDCGAGSLALRDTKNRSDHKLLLSRQALEIVVRYCPGRKPADALFPIVDARKTLAWKNAVGYDRARAPTARDDGSL